MPILQNKLVWKSIEALHDEAIGTMPDVGKDVGIIKSRPAIISNNKSANDLTSDKSEKNVSARFDPLVNAPDENKKDTSSLDKLKLKSEILESTGQSASRNNKTEPEIETKKSEDLPIDNPPSTDQVLALADIAAAIHQAQTTPNNAPDAKTDYDDAPPLDVVKLSASISEEVRKTVSSIIASELPDLIRQALHDVIRDMPSALPKQETPKSLKKMQSKKGTTKKTPVTKRAPAKKAGNKKTRAKKNVAKSHPPQDKSQES